MRVYVAAAAAAAAGEAVTVPVALRSTMKEYCLTLCPPGPAPLVEPQRHAERRRVRPAWSETPVSGTSSAKNHKLVPKVAVWDAPLVVVVLRRRGSGLIGGGGLGRASPTPRPQPSAATVSDCKQCVDTFWWSLSPAVAESIRRTFLQTQSSMTGRSASRQK